jgi:glycosyltransferase involved in cell wall biosynthesis
LQLVLQEVENKYPQVSFLVIADHAPSLKLKNLDFKKWTKESEIEDLIQADIGIMPLPDDEWAKGKCGFKALQYMALEIPCIASPVGVNPTIIHHGINGFLCNTSGEWMACFDALITNESYRKQIGQQGRITVEKGYSVVSNSSTFLSLFR